MRADSAELLPRAAGALLEGGVNAMEVTMTTPDALGAISCIARELAGRMRIGAGSVLDAETARAALLAGAEFLVTPALRPEVIAMGHRYGKPVLCGVATPTEALAACEAGADFVKLFPAASLGPRFLHELLAPLPHLAVVPTGGITPQNAVQWIAAGSVALGIGSGLVNRAILKSRDWNALAEAATAYVEAVQDARKLPGAPPA